MAGEGKAGKGGAGKGSKAPTPAKEQPTGPVDGKAPQQQKKRQVPTKAGAVLTDLKSSRTTRTRWIASG